MARKVRDQDFYPVPKEVEICPLCDRELEERDANEHHLIPAHKGGAKGPTVRLHVFCHNKVHSVFTNSELAKSYNTVEALRTHVEIQKFVSWVENKPSNYLDRNVRKSERRGKT